MKQNESVKKLEIGKDYINVHDNNLIVIDRVGSFDNKGFYEDLYKKDIPCTNCGTWREATEEEVVEAFKKHLAIRYGEDWGTMKIKERHPDLSSSNIINDRSWNVEIYKACNGWKVWNQNGLLYFNGIWVERLEEKEEELKITIQDAIKENTVIHCETEEEAERILGMAHVGGYKWHTGKNYQNDTEWNIYKSTMCYYLFDGSYSDCDYFKNRNYTIIPSTQIADVGEKKTADWTTPPKDFEYKKIKEIKMKASNTQIGGSHYSDMAIQPTEFIHKNNLSFIQGNIIKYVCRYKSKGGIEDLNKAKHYIDLLIELEEE